MEGNVVARSILEEAQASSANGLLDHRQSTVLRAMVVGIEVALDRADQRLGHGGHRGGAQYPSIASVLTSTAIVNTNTMLRNR